AESPLRLELTDRRCRRIYLLLAHLLPLPVLLLARIGPVEILLGLVLVLFSGLFWLWRERRPQPQALSWDGERGWRLHWGDEQGSAGPPRFLMLGSCLLLEVDGQLFFLPERPGLNRLRRLLRGGHGLPRDP
ncbi:MAG: hypothetical protein H7842_04990, partial [Gammaproteobacteria bacterium SHHR-1]